MRAALGVLLTVGLSGCAAGAGAATSVASTSAAPGPSYTVHALTAAVPKPKTAAPALKNTGAAWPAILASLSAYGQWLLANPDPALVATIAQPGCAMTDLLSRQVTALYEEGAYLKPSPPVFTLISGLSPAIGNEAGLDVTASRAAEPVLGATTGTVISTFDPLPTTDLDITLYRGADNKWRFCTVNTAADTGANDDPSVPLL
jgi:hypothetical protein